MGVDDAWVSPLHVERSANNERITRCASLSFNYVCRLNDVGDEQEIWNVFFCLRCCSRFRWNCYVCDNKPWATTSTSQSRYIYNHLFIYIYISVVIHQCCVWDTQCPTNSFGTNVKRLSVVYLYIYISFFFPSRTHLKYEFKTVYSHRQKRLIDHIICWVVTFSFFPFFFFTALYRTATGTKIKTEKKKRSVMHSSVWPCTGWKTLAAGSRLRMLMISGAFSAEWNEAATKPEVTPFQLNVNRCSAHEPVLWQSHHGHHCSPLKLDKDNKDIKLRPKYHI